MDERSIEFLSLLGYLYLRHGQADRAITALEAVLLFRPGDGHTVRSLAYAYLADGRYADCLQALEAAGVRGQTWSELLRSRALWGLGRREEARRVMARISGDLRAGDGQ